jgi:hypothetical protein
MLSFFLKKKSLRGAFDRRAFPAVPCVPPCRPVSRIRNKRVAHTGAECAVPDSTRLLTRHEHRAGAAHRPFSSRRCCLPSPATSGWPPRTAPPRRTSPPRKVAAAPRKGEHWQRRVRRWGAPSGRTSLPSVPTTAATTLETAIIWSDFFPFP